MNNDYAPFDPSSLNIDDIEEIIHIDTDTIDEESTNSARELVDNLYNIYYDENFIKNNPKLKKRIDTELESLRVLYKMRMSDEITHDILLKAISNNSGNASLYRSLTEVQKAILSITTKINEIIEGLNQILKGYQLEIQFNEDNESSNEQDEDSQEDVSVYRGTKDFIKKMIENKKEEVV